MEYDVAVIGGGPGGMAAALAAEEAGARTLLLETDNTLGGILNQCIHNGFGLHIFGEELTGPEYAHRFRQRVERSNIDVLCSTLVTGVSADKTITAVSKACGLLSIRAKAVVFSTGCRERPRGAINIPGTRPAGVLTAGTAQKYVNIFGHSIGKECVILGSGDIGLIMARRMTFEGARVRAVVELMPFSSGLQRNIAQCLEDFQIPLLLSHTVTEIRGENRIEGVTVAQVDEKHRPIPGTEQNIPCDTLLLSVGLIPQTALCAGTGAGLVRGALKVDQRLATTVEGVYACGNGLHVHDLVDYVTEESTIAGRCAAEYARTGGGNGQERFVIEPGEGITYAIPQMLRGKLMENVPVRFRTRGVYRNCRIAVTLDGEPLMHIKKPVMAPGEMQSIRLRAKDLQGKSGKIEIAVERSGTA